MARSTIKTWSTPIAAERTRTVPCALCGGLTFVPALDCRGFVFVRCADCGLVQQNPQPSPDEVAARYDDRHGEDYLNYELENEASFLRLQELALADVGFPKIEASIKAGADQPRVLDVGCATGALLEWFRNRGWRTAGVELCGPSSEYARTARGLDVRTAAAEAAGFQDGSFDLVHASHLIEHLNAPKAFVESVRRMLKPGGRFLVSTPNIDGFQARLFGAEWRSAIFDHLYLFSKGTLRNLLADEGFRVEKIVTWGGLAAGTAPRPVKRFADRAVKKIGAGDVMMISAVAPQGFPN